MQVAGFRFRVAGLEVWVLDFGFRVERSFGFRGETFLFLQVSGCGSGISGFGFRVSGFGFRGSRFGFRVSDFGFRISSFEFRVSGFGFRV